MGNIHKPVRVGVATLVTRDDHVLMGRRKNVNAGDGEWAFPGGKPEAGESPAAAACRELFEETGIAVHVGHLRQLPAWSYDYFPEIDLHYVTLNFWVPCPLEATAITTEPEKCHGWTWLKLKKSPFKGEPWSVNRTGSNFALFQGVADALEALGKELH